MKRLAIAHLNSNPRIESSEFENKLITKHPSLKINRTSPYQFEILHGDATNKDNKSVVTSYPMTNYIDAPSYKHVNMFLNEEINSTFHAKISHKTDNKLSNRYFKVKSNNIETATKHILKHSNDIGLKECLLEEIRVI